MHGKNSKDDGIERYHDMDHKSDTAHQLRSIYADWADTYDEDNDNKLRTVSQPLTVEMLKRHCDQPGTKILDVGCGTGQVGRYFKKAGYNNYDGSDPSEEMLAHARTRGYGQLFVLAPGEPLPVANAAYDAATCVGVFTHGHLGPEGFEELLRITKPGGLIFFTVNEGVWVSGQFEEAITTLVAADRWHILEMEKRDYMINENVQAWYVAARKTG